MVPGLGLLHIVVLLSLKASASSLLMIFFPLFSGFLEHQILPLSVILMVS